MNSPGQQPSDTHDLSTSPGDLNADNRRRRPAANGRGVNTLSKEALDKKRDNDRKAQAAIRKRQKDEVAGLKLQIQVLNSQKPYLELQSVIEEKNAVQGENEKLRAALRGITDTIHQLIGSVGQDYSTAAAQQTAQAALRSSSLNNGLPNPNPATVPTSYTSPPPTHSAAHDLPGASATLPYRRNVVSEQRESMQRHHHFNNHESLDFRFLFEKQQRSSQPPSAYPRRRTSASIHSAPPSVAGDPKPQYPWNVLPLLTPPVTELERLLTDFITENRQPPTSPRTSAYPTNPSISILLNPLESTASSSSASPDIARYMRDAIGTEPPPTPATLSSYMSKLVMFFDNLTGLPEKVAVCYFMYGVMRWQTFPSEENYYLMPEILRPCGSQLSIRHPVWMDSLPWPAMRDKLIKGNQNDYTFSPRWYEAFTEDLSVNWPYSEATCLSSTGSEGQEEINPAFIEHLSRIESWTLGSRFFSLFPELQGTAPCKDRSDRPDRISEPQYGERMPQGFNEGKPNTDYSRRSVHGNDHQRHGSYSGYYEHGG